MSSQSTHQSDTEYRGRRMWSGDLADVMYCIRCQRQNKTYGPTAIGQMLDNWEGLKVGHFVLVRDITNKTCTIERVMSPEEIDRQRREGSLLTSILPCIGFPISRVRIVMTAEQSADWCISISSLVDSERRAVAERDQLLAGNLDSMRALVRAGIAVLGNQLANKSSGELAEIWIDATCALPVAFHALTSATIQRLQSLESAKHQPTGD